MTALYGPLTNNDLVAGLAQDHQRPDAPWGSLDGVGVGVAGFATQ